jgi:hypothetical protein
MPDERYIDKPSLTDARVDDNTRVRLTAVAATGKLYHYTASGSEGTALVIPVLSARSILGIWREGQMLYPVALTPDTISYIWDLTTITFGLALNTGERLGILYKNA